MDIFAAYKIGTEGTLKSVPNDWCSPTALRPLILGDNCIPWLEHHGHRYGLTRDSEENSMLSLLGEMGAGFEAKWVKEMVPEAAHANQNDYDVRSVKAFLSTLEFMARRTPVIAKAALWHAPAKLYGTCDLICLGSWLLEQFPQLEKQLREDELDLYHVIDLKFITGIDTTEKKTDLKLASSQVRLYSFMLGALQGRVPSHAFLVTRDRVFDPLPVEVGYALGDPLEMETKRLLGLLRHIKLHGHKYKPWKDAIVAPDWKGEDGKWTTAKKRILEEFMPQRPLELLPHVGNNEAEGLREAGFASIDDLLARGHRFDLANVKGLGKATSRRIRAVLDANRSGRAAPLRVPVEMVPPRCKREFFVDYEFAPTLLVDFEKEWPSLKGREMVFMIGCGWEEKGKWRFERFTADDYTPEAERAIFEQFIAFLRKRGAVYGSVQEATVVEGTALYHWSQAEVSQSANVAKRLGIDVLTSLPWVDLKEAFEVGPLALKGMWNWSIKSVLEAVGDVSPEHRVDYPEGLSAGDNAMVLALRAYQRGGDVLGSPEIMLITNYLETDCKGLWQILRWLRASVHNEEIPSARAVRGRVGATSHGFRWYRVSQALNERGLLRVA
jgi:hypothetical protein